VLHSPSAAAQRLRRKQGESMLLREAIGDVGPLDQRAKKVKKIYRPDGSVREIVDDLSSIYRAATAKKDGSEGRRFARPRTSQHKKIQNPNRNYQGYHESLYRGFMR
jgi:hypothetical protein